MTASWRRGLRETRLKFGPGERLCQKEGTANEAIPVEVVRGSKMSNMVVPMFYTWKNKQTNQKTKATWDQAGFCRKRTDIDSLLRGILTVGGKGLPWWESECLGEQGEGDSRPHLQSQYEGLWLCTLDNSSGVSDTEAPGPHSRSWFRV